MLINNYSPIIKDKEEDREDSKKLLDIIESDLNKRDVLIKDFNFNLNDSKYTVYLDKYTKKGFYQDYEKISNENKLYKI